MSAPIVTAEEQIASVAQAVDLPLGVVQGVVKELAEHPEHGRAEMARRWGVAYGKLNRVQSLCRDRILEVREGLSERSLAIVAVAQEHLIEKLESPAEIAELSAKDLSAIAKQQGDLSLNLANGQSGGTKNEFNIGEIKAVISMGVPQMPKLEDLQK